MRWDLYRVLRGFAAILALFLLTASALEAQATGTVSGRVVEAESSRPIADVQLTVDGSVLRSSSNAQGQFTIVNVPAGARSITARRIGYVQRTVNVTITAGQVATLEVTLTPTVSQLDAIVVTALGQTTEQRALGTSQQTVQGADIAQTQRENFINALQGRVAGVEVTSTSGVPGASSSITIRGVSSISSSNQPLFIIDGLPMDNKTLNTGVLASDFGGSAIGFANRGLDFTNRAADINPEDIETLVILKGPEASALYGIDAANGAVVITTRRGRPGIGGFEYSNSFRLERLGRQPELQRVYSPSAASGGGFSYWGDPYEPGTQFYDNIGGFFRTGLTQKHNLSFSGAAADNRVNYRVAGGITMQEGVIPGSSYDRYNLTGRSGSQVNDWLNVDLSLQYSYADNEQPRNGAFGPLIGLLLWPQTDNAADYLTPAGIRRRATNLGTGEMDNPYYNVAKNRVESSNSRIIANLGFVLTPFTWASLRTNLGTDSYTNQNQILRHPESWYGISNNGILDVANDFTRNLSSQTVLSFSSQALTRDVSVSGFVGNAINDFKSTTDAMMGRDFLEPDFVSVNNTNIRTSRTSIAQRRLVGLFGSATLDYRRILYVTATGRNDWTSTIPRGANSFFYPSISTSFIFSDAFPMIGEVMTGKLRAAYAEVGKDARPYAYVPSLEYKTTSYGGYGYGFWGPNRGLQPEFARSYELGTELAFLQDRLGLDVTVYRKQTKDQIVDNIRGSYATGFILFNLNGAETRNQGVELSLRGTPILRQGFSWDFLANFERSRGRVLALPHELPESYLSDTWLYGNVRNGTMPGLSTRSMTGLYYLRNDAGDLLINPTTGLPLRATTFIDAGYDRHPDFTIGLSNTLRYGNTSLSFLIDIRRGGDVLNATEHFLTARGLSMRTLDRDEPRVIEGVLRDGKENTDNPTRNTIVIIPSVSPAYYTAISEENFIEKDVNWVRLRDVTLRFRLPERLGRNSSVFVTGTDLLLFTNYSGLDPVVNGNTAAVGGSGAVGIDYGNFPMPRGFNFGVQTSF